MRWLFGYVIASLVGSFFVVRIFDYIFAGVVGTAVTAAKAGLFVSIWSAITTGSGMRDVNKRVKQLRRVARGMSKRLE